MQEGGSFIDGGFFSANYIKYTENIVKISPNKCLLINCQCDMIHIDGGRKRQIIQSFCKPGILEYLYRQNSILESVKRIKKEKKT